MYSPVFWTFLEMDWGALRVFWWSWFSLCWSCSLLDPAPALKLSFVLCNHHGLEQEIQLQNGVALPSYGSTFQANPIINCLLDDCWCLGHSSALTFYYLGFYIGQKPSYHLTKIRDKIHPLGTEGLHILNDWATSAPFSSISFVFLVLCFLHLLLQTFSL